MAAAAYPILEGLDGRRPHMVPEGKIVRLGNGAVAIIRGVAYIDDACNATAIVEDGGKVYAEGACTVVVCAGGSARTDASVVTADLEANVRGCGHVCPNDVLSRDTLMIHNSVTVLAGGYGNFGYGSVVHCLRDGHVDQFGG